MTARSLKATGIPKRFWGMSLSDLQQSTDAVYAVEEYLENIADYRDQGVGVLLHGEPGMGKTTLASIIGVTAFSLGYSVAYTTMASFVHRQIQNMGNRDAGKNPDYSPETRREAGDRWMAFTKQMSYWRNRLDFLIIDDVGKEHTTSTRFAEDEFDYLFRHRFDKGNPTVLTSNIPITKWASRYSDSMFSFIHEACEIVPVTADVDYRRA